MKKKVGKWIFTIVGVLFGNALLAFGVAAFIVPQGMITGGATGLGIAINRFFGMDISLAVAICNVVLFIAGVLCLGKKFALTTIVSTVVYPMFLSMFTASEWIGNLTDNMILATAYAGMLIGASVGIVIRFGASTGGMDIPPLILNKKFGIPVAVSMYVTDFAVLMLQVFTASAEQVLYGILIVILSSIMLNYVCLAGQKKIQVMIISQKHEEILNVLLRELDLGVTLFHIETGYLQKQGKAVVCVTNSRKLFSIQETVQNLDPKAFMSVTHINEVRGRGFTLDRNYNIDSSGKAEKRNA